jgi:tRNA pseudouridine13 synthase
LKDASGQQWTTNTISQHIVDQRTTTAAIVANWSARASRKRQRVATPAMIHVFVVRKSNVEHRMAVEKLARALDCSQGDIQWAGIKDRQAITYQFCSVNHVPISRIRTAHSKLSAQGIALGGPIRHVTEPLRKGQAKGNRFTIVVRNVRQIHVQEDQNGQTKEDLMHCQKEKMETAVKRLQLTGFLNLYGQQRIGPVGAQVRSVDVGRALLQHDFGRVIDLTMRMATDASSLRVRNVWVESRGDPKMTSKALSKGKGGQRHQRTILHAMQRDGAEDPMRTVQCLSHSERTFWINSYQAFVWNSVAAERIRLYGSDQVVVGDLVAAEANHPPIRVLSPEMASKYAIHHVVLPLPGYTVEYPSNAVATVYENILFKDKIVFRKDAPLDSTAKGSYRPLVVTVPRLEHVWIAGTTSPPACRLTFDLPSGAYATSLLRELMYTTVERDM